MKKILFIFCILIIIGSCSTRESTVKELKAEIYYFKDYRTGLCYAVYSNWNLNNFSFTNVPCDKIPPDLFVNFK